MQTPNLTDFQKDTEALILRGFRFSVVHNPDEKYLKIIASQNCDKIKNKFPHFNIYLTDRKPLTKMVESVYYYDE